MARNSSLYGGTAAVSMQGVSDLSRMYAGQDRVKAARIGAQGRVQAAEITSSGAMDRAQLHEGNVWDIAQQKLAAQLDKAASDKEYKQQYLSFLGTKLDAQNQREMAKLVDLSEYRQNMIKMRAWTNENQAYYHQILRARLQEASRANRVKEGQGQQRVDIMGYNAQTGRQRANTGVYNAGTSRMRAKTYDIGTRGRLAYNQANLQRMGRKDRVDAGYKQGLLDRYSDQSAAKATELGQLGPLRQAQARLNTLKANAYPYEAEARIQQQRANTSFLKQKPGLYAARTKAQVDMFNARRSDTESRFQRGEGAKNTRFAIAGRTGKMSFLTALKQKYAQAIMQSPEGPALLNEEHDNMIRQAFPNATPEQVTAYRTAGQYVSRQEALNSLVDRLMYLHLGQNPQGQDMETDASDYLDPYGSGKY